MLISEQMFFISYVLPFIYYLLRKYIFLWFWKRLFLSLPTVLTYLGFFAFHSEHMYCNVSGNGLNFFWCYARELVSVSSANRLMLRHFFINSSIIATIFLFLFLSSISNKPSNDIDFIYSQTYSLDYFPLLFKNQSSFSQSLTKSTHFPIYQFFDFI